MLINRMNLVLGATLALVGVYSIWRGKRPSSPLHTNSENEPAIDCVDLGSELSFPASDPPAHNHSG
jgi:hypothetical protein